MGEISFRGVSTSSLTGVYVLEMPSHKKAGKRMTEYRVKGRDGVLHVDDGFDNFDITVRLILINTGADRRQVVNAWADGTGKLITSDNLTLAYKATVKEEIVWHRDVAAALIPAFLTTKQYYVGDLVIYSSSVYKFTANHKGSWNSAHAAVQNFLVKGVYDWCEITFDCQPHMYEAVDSVIEVTSDLTNWTNPGTDDAYPLIKVQGTDTYAVCFYFCDEYIIIRGIDPNDPVFIDCETGYIYTESGQPMTMEGNIPKIPLGTNSIAFNMEHPPTKLTVTPRWRWV